MPVAAQRTPFAEAYEDELKELTTNELAKLKLLRDLAKENMQEAVNIVGAIERHLLSCLPAYQLPCLFLLDIVLKTVPDPYVPLIAQKIAGLFFHVWDSSTPEVQAKLRKTAGTWQGILPAPVMSIITAKQAQTQAPVMAPPASTSMYGTRVHDPTRQPLQPVFGMPVSSNGQGNDAVRLAPPQGFQQSTPSFILAPPQLNAQGYPYQLQPQFLSQSQQQYQQQPQVQQQVNQQRWMQPVQQFASSLPQPPMSQQQVFSIQPQQQVQSLNTVGFAPQGNGGALFSGFQQPSILQQPQQQQSFGIQIRAQPYQQQHPQQQHFLPQVSQLGGQLAFSGNSGWAGAAANWAGGGQQMPGGMQPMQQLSQQTIAQQSPQHQIRNISPEVVSQSQVQSKPLAKACAQGLKNLSKAFRQEAVDELVSASDSSRGKFMDIMFLRNRRLQSSQHQVRHWFTNIENWIQGSQPAEDTSVNFFEAEEEEEREKEAVQPMPMVEEDPSQPSCAISGETFERIYDPDTDKWYYEDAVVLSGENAAVYGLMDGSIVKVHSLAGAPPAMAASLNLSIPQGSVLSVSEVEETGSVPTRSISEQGAGKLESRPVQQPVSDEITATGPAIGVQGTAQYISSAVENDGGDLASASLQGAGSKLSDSSNPPPPLSQGGGKRPLDQGLPPPGQVTLQLKQETATFPPVPVKMESQHDVALSKRVKLEV